MNRRTICQSVAIAGFATIPFALSAQNEPPCPRPAPRPVAVGDAIRIADPPAFPCSLAIVETGVVLRGDGGGVPDPGVTAAMDSRGRFFTGSQSGALLVWSPTGRFERAISKAGNGRLEFSRGDFFPFVDHQQRIHVLHGTGNWTVLSPALEIVADELALPIKADEYLSSITGDGTFVSAIAGGGTWFHVARVTDTTARTFGDFMAAGGVTSDRASAHNRLVGYGGADAFWATSEPGSRFGYMLDLYGVDGSRRLTVDRTTPWFPRGTGESPGRTAIVPVLYAPNADTTGLLVTMTVMPAPGTSPPRVEPGSPIRERPPMVSYVEIIDTRAGVVLASERLDGAAPELITGMFGGTLMGFRAHRSADGKRELRIVELRLSAR